MYVVGFLFEKLVPRGVTLSTIIYMEHFAKYSDCKVLAYIEADGNDLNLLDRISQAANKIIIANKNERFEEADLVYYQYAGGEHGYMHLNSKIFAHIVFQNYTNSAINKTYISSWLAEASFFNKSNYVPLPVNLMNVTGNFRTELGLGKNDFVIGRIGGEDSFDIDFVKDEINKYSGNIKFLFASTNKFTENKNCIFLGKLYGEDVSKFYNTIDCFLHGRYRGESFGMSLMEAKLFGKRSMVWLGGVDRNHLRICDNNLIYRGRRSFRKILNKMKKPSDRPSSIESYNYDCYSRLVERMKFSVRENPYFGLRKILIPFSRRIKSFFTFVLCRLSFIL